MNIHEHYDDARDKRWACVVSPCLTPEVAPMPGRPVASAARSAALRAWIAEANPDALLADGFEAAIVGVAERCSQPTLVVYDIARCIEILQSRDGMTADEAAEFFAFNTLGAWVGDHTPLFLTRPPR